VLHHRASEVDAMLDMYEIGDVRRLQFKEAWGVAVGPDGLRYVSVAEAFRAWVRFLYLVIDMENALTNDFSTLRRQATAGESPSEITPMKVQMIVDTHRRFMLNQFATLVGDGVRELWALTTGLCAPHDDVRWLGQELDALASSVDAQIVHGLAAYMDELVERLNDQERDDADALECLRMLGNRIYREDRRFLAEMKLALRDGLRVFEEFEDRAVADGGERLLASMRRVPPIVDRFYTRLANEARTISGEPLMSDWIARLRGEMSSEQTGSHPAHLLGHGAAIDAGALGSARTEQRE
ncbi:MAG: hypothetical protein M3439_05130, partial [Chloroflexota bacterium]|nr:hypothetical protein [Chloroflexota bacterium]